MTATLPEFLFHWAERTPESIFVTRARPRADVHLRPGCGLRREVSRAPAATRRQTRRPRAILADNSCVWLVGYLGTLAQGAVAAPLNTRHAADDLDQCSTTSIPR